MRDELKARRADVERLRTEEQHKGSGGVRDTHSRIPTTDILNLLLATTEVRPYRGASARGAQGSTLWFPDLGRDEQFFDIDIMVKF
jgi:hypothetical protein